MKRTAVIAGAGPGLGYSLAEIFGRRGFRVVLLARNEQKLNQLQQELSAKGLEAFVYPADVSDNSSLEAAFGAITERFGTPDVLIYNVGITTLDADTHIDAEVLLQRYQMDVAGAYRCIQMVDHSEFAQKNGAILVTGGGLAIHPNFTYLPLSMDKAALRAMVYALHPVLKEKGIFLGLVTIMGGIKAGTDFAPERIAETYWKMYEERSQCEVRFEKTTEG